MTGLGWMFQSTPVISDGRIGATADDPLGLARFQSTPVISDGRIYWRGF